MKFCEAMELLKNGAKVTRNVWKGSLYFMMQDKDVITFQPRLINYPYDEGIMISDGWKVEDDENEYSFCEIIPLLIEGKKAYMEDWKDSFISLDRNSRKIVLHLMDSFPFVPEIDSFIATDWIQE